MVNKKSRKSVRKIWKRTPGGKTKLISVRKEKEGKPLCALCHSQLSGVNSTGCKSEKIPTRTFAGYLCASCVRKVTKVATLVKDGEKKIEDVAISIKPYVSVLVKKL